MPLVSGVFRFGGEIAGDRPPRYVPSDVFRLDRTIAGDRPPRYGSSSVFFREITLTKNAKFAKIISVLNIFGDFSREFDCFHDFSRKNVDKKLRFL